jgi:hypothetical protein
MEPFEIRRLLERIAGIHLGVDIGQKSDHTAITVVAVGERATQQMYLDFRDHKLHAMPESTYTVQEMERLPLGTAFKDVAARLVDLVGGLWAWENDVRKQGMITPYEPQLTWDLWVDATGLGLPVVETIRDALNVSPKTARCHVHPTVFTHGDRFVRGGYEQRGDVLGKAYLVSRLVNLIEQRRLILRKSAPDLDAMMEELRTYETHIEPDANDKYGAFAVGAHDDMVTALGLACVEEPGYYSVQPGPTIWR